MSGPRKWTYDDLRSAVAEAMSIADICRSLGIVACGGNYEVVRHYAAQLELQLPARGPGTAPIRGLVARIDEVEFSQAVADARSLNEVGRLLGLRRSGGVTEAIRRRILLLGLDASHFVTATADAARFVQPTRPLSEVLRIGTRYRTSTLRQRLIDEGLKSHRCEECGLSEWNERPIPLELEHVNGDRWDNRIENLKLLCPNCHALTPTYRGRNIGRSAGVAQSW